MRVITSPLEMQHHALALLAAGRTIGLVPTMGYLHEGHASLARIARPRCDEVVLSIFVNPTQFGPGEDLDKYPRDFARDEAICREAGVDTIFFPSAPDMYPAGYSVFLEEHALSAGLCGVSRPNHFRGVLTVVAKLFNLCLPHLAVFGEKDAQQLRVIRQMTRDLNFPLEIVPGPIVREADGLAMSSRNKYLTPDERRDAVLLRQSLDLAEMLAAGGVTEAAEILRSVRDHIESSPHARIDYAVMVDDEMLTPVEALRAPALLALAVHFGKARLLDNTVLRPES
jgi:pantoate--beta-alanine ligase